MKVSVLDRFKNKQQRRAALLSLLYWFVMIVYLELVLHIAALGDLTAKFGYVLGFSFVIACTVALVTSFLPEKVRFVAEIVLTAVVIVLYGSQLVYYFVFTTLYSVSMIQQGGAAVTNFWKETLVTMWEKLPWILSLLVPMVGLCLLRKFSRGKTEKTNWLWRVILLVAAVLLQIVTTACISIGGTGYFTDYHYYHSNTATTDQVASRYGLLTAFRLDMFGSGQEEQEQEDEGYYVETQPADSEEADATEPVEVEYNVLEFDFEALNEQTDKKAIQAINNYCASITGTNKNEYTGMLKDYNLIVICAESFATGAIDKELTPTLYRLANEGFIFNNYYNTYPNNTTDGEYTLCMGLYPDISRDKKSSSFYSSRNSYLPFTLGNLFLEQREIQSYGHHNNYGSYYGRDESHPNMGYKMKFINKGMKFTTTSPFSDFEMMEQTVGDYITADSQFHAYHMTFSGHYKYDKSINPMAARNWNQVKGLDYSNPVKAYLACNIELEKAMAYLMQKLEEAGVADKTAIVLAGDHFPYGLTDAEYGELMGYEIDNFNKFKSTLIFWAGGLEENIVVDEYCCNVDILPTILNLWGFDYDSRMLAGTDVFSDGTHMAVLADSSFFTDKVWFSAADGQIRYQVAESEVPENYVESMIKLIETKRSISVDILNSAYYNFLFGKEPVNVTRNSWNT